MRIRDAVEGDADALAALADQPADVMRNLVHDRTVRVAETDDADDGEPPLLGFVSYDAREGTVHVTQFAGEPSVARELLEEPLGFAAREGMDAEVVVGAGEDTRREAVEAAGFRENGPGPTFRGQPTVRYRASP